MNLKINTNIDMSGIKSYNVGTPSIRNNGVNRGNNNLNNYNEIDYSNNAVNRIAGNTKNPNSYNSTNVAKPVSAVNYIKSNDAVIPSLQKAVSIIEKTNNYQLNGNKTVNNINATATTYGKNNNVGKNTTNYSPKITLMEQTLGGEDEGTHTLSDEFQGSGNTGAQNSNNSNTPIGMIKGAINSVSAGTAGAKNANTSGTINGMVGGAINSVSAGVAGAKNANTSGTINGMVGGAFNSVSSGVAGAKNANTSGTVNTGKSITNAPKTVIRSINTSNNLTNLKNNSLKTGNAINDINR